MYLRKTILVLAVLLAVGGVVYWFARAGNFIDRPGSGRNVIFLGDSLVAGVGAEPGRDLASVLSRIAAVPIMNAGASGDTTADGLTRLSRDVLSQDPKVVIVLLGGNDILRNLPEKQAMQNLSEMIDAIHGRGAAVLLLGLRGGTASYRTSYAEGYKELAKTKRVSFVPDILGGIMGNPSLMSDSIHPNSLGYELMAEKIAPVLRKMLK